MHPPRQKTKIGAEVRRPPRRGVCEKNEGIKKNLSPKICILKKSLLILQYQIITLKTLTDHEMKDLKWLVLQIANKLNLLETDENQPRITEIRGLIYELLDRISKL